MLQYDLKKRLSAEQLNNHKFLTKQYSELNKINLKEASKNIVGSRLRLNSKKNQSIWVIFEDDEDSLDNISPEMYEKKNSENYNNYIQNQKDDKNKYEEKKINDEFGSKGYIDENTMKKEILEAFDIMNDDCIYIEPKLIPIIPGDDPAVINKVSDFNEDNF